MVRASIVVQIGMSSNNRTTKLKSFLNKQLVIARSKRDKLVIFLDHFLLERVLGVHCSTLMVASIQKHRVYVLQLQSKTIIEESELE